MQKITLVNNSHSIGNFLKCPKRFYYSQILGIEPMKTYRPFLRGHIVTELLSYLYQAKMNGTYTPMTPLTACELLIDNSELETKDKALLTNRFLQYVKYYINESWYPIACERCSLYPNEENPGTGFSKIIFENETFLFVYEGTPDLIVKINKHKDTLLLVDNKTQSRKKDLFPHAIQFKGYSWGTGIRDFCINYFGLQESGKADKLFRRELITYTDAQIEQWRIDMVRIYFDMIVAIKNKMLYRTWQCEGTYSICDYFDLCKNSYIPFVEKDHIRRHYKAKVRKTSW